MVSADSGVYRPETFYGLEADTKPSGYPNGSMFFEMDTGKLYFYDAENAEWKEWAKSE